jgi:hypothetical protein
MNKQEVIEKLESRKNWNSSLSDSFNEGYKGGIGFALDLATKIDVPKKVIFKQHEKFVVEWLQSHKYSSDLIDLYSEIEYATDSDGFISDKWCYPSEFYDWLSWDTDKLFILADAMRYGYEVEKEQLYYVDFINDGDVHKRLVLDNENGKYNIVDWSENLIGLVQEMFTESDVNKVNPDFMAFAVKVED